VIEYSIGFLHKAVECGLASRSEADAHPHVSEERGELFHVVDGNATEFEYLVFLHSLVLVTKPLIVLETGTGLGYGTIAIAAALAANGYGVLHSVDVGDQTSASELLHRASLDAFVQLHRCSGLEFCANLRTPIDFAFFDSDVSCRHLEATMLCRRKMANPNAILTFHDTSPLRFAWGDNSALCAWLSERGAFNLPLSRGFSMLRVDSNRETF
jgi:hypothetical protein